MTDPPRADPLPKPASARGFAVFAEICAKENARLYAELAARVAEAPDLLDLLSDRLPGQPPSNLLFGAVHERLLAGVAHPLAEFYPSLGGTRPADEAFPLFRAFVREFEPDLRETIRTHRVQTNEVGRCGLLLPAFALAFSRLGDRPLHLIEFGTSAGLLLGFDRYAYRYDDGRTCGKASPAIVRTALGGDRICPIPEAMPTVAARVGVDARPIDVMDDDAIRWTEALIWPDMTDRIALFRAAVALAREAPPAVRAGDGVELVPRLAEAAPAEHVPCVFHSHATYQMKRPRRAAFTASLDDLGRRRDLAHISLEWLEDEPGPQLRLTTWRDGEATKTHLADAHHHGRWMRWLD